MGKTKRCAFCFSCENDIYNLGDFERTGKIQAHYFCALLSSNITQSGQDNEGILGFLEADLQNEIERGAQLKCYYCKQLGATLKCFHKGCRRTFHLPCGLRKELHIDFSKFTTICNSHRRKSNRRKSKKSSKNTKVACIVCLEEDDPDLFVVQCCKKHIHQMCAKKYARNSGYLAKCPTCNNTDNFVQCIQAHGVFVPLRDASWELDDQAFDDLMFVYNRCDAETCICPNGRYYKKSKRWNLYRCQYCGSSAIHRPCFKIKNKYTCSRCIFVTENKITPNNCTEVSSHDVSHSGLSGETPSSERREKRKCSNTLLDSSKKRKDNE